MARPVTTVPRYAPPLIKKKKKKKEMLFKSSRKYFKINKKE